MEINHIGKVFDRSYHSRMYIEREGFEGFQPPYTDQAFTKVPK